MYITDNTKIGEVFAKFIFGAVVGLFLSLILYISYPFGKFRYFISCSSSCKQSAKMPVLALKSPPINKRSDSENVADFIL